jgi:predicted RNA-binding Zn-ribbon protein involved in translation (DUF1610 family)
MKKEARVASRDFGGKSGSRAKLRLENNNSCNDVVDTDQKMPRKCPICGSSMRPSGELQMISPSTGRRRRVQVYNCSRCGYRTIG